MMTDQEVRLQRQGDQGCRNVAWGGGVKGI